MNRPVTSNRLLFFTMLISFSLLGWMGSGCDDSSDDENEDQNSSGNQETNNTAGEEGASGSDSSEEKDSGAGETATSESDLRTNGCQCLMDRGVVTDESLRSACEENISEDCFNCLNEVTAGASCTGKSEDEFSSCQADCASIIPPPETTEECNTLVSYGQSPDAVTDCMCEKCLDSFGECIVNTICQDIIKCGDENNCSGAACVDPCGDELAAADPDTLAIAIAVDTCSADNLCLEEASEE